VSVLLLRWERTFSRLFPAAKREENVDDHDWASNDEQYNDPTHRGGTKEWFHEDQQEEKTERECEDDKTIL
jgi:hypothetical protein